MPTFNLPNSIWLESTTRLPNGSFQADFGMNSSGDAANLPPLSDHVASGSSAFFAQDKKLFMLDSNGNWS